MTDVRAKLGEHRRVSICEHCGAYAGKRHDRLCPAAKRARKAIRRGKDRERYVERTYGPRKVGQFGDAVDNIGRTFKWQSKTTTAEPPWWVKGGTDGRGHYHTPVSDPCYIATAAWITEPLEHMRGIRDDLAPLLIRSWTHQGRQSHDVIVVPREAWEGWHGPACGAGGEYVVMSGSAFLDIHGRDEP